MLMANKTKTTKTIDTINDTAKQAGLVLMAAAMTLGLLEVPHEQDKRAVMPVNPVFETVGIVGEHGNDSQRREREETGPHYISYGVNQRTPGRTGKI
jgi:hypothetical protein